MNPDILRQLALRHARTAALLGVDAVPLAAHDAAHRDGPASSPPGSASVPPAPASAGVPAAVPARPDASTAPSAARAPLTLVGSGPVFDLKPVPRERGAVRAALDRLRQQYELDAPHQHFVTDHHRIVFDDGDPCARLMFVGEAPGADEDRTGVPFVGRAGQLLNKMIVAMGLSREGVYIANVLKTRPPDNATPTSEEIRLCTPYLLEQIRIVGPEVIVTLGLPATRALLGTMESMSRLRGQWASVTPPGSERPIAVMPTYHPAFLLRSYTEENRKKVWSDLQQVMTRLNLRPPSSSSQE